MMMKIDGGAGGHQKEAVLAGSCLPSSHTNDDDDDGDQDDDLDGVEDDADADDVVSTDDEYIILKS